GDVALPDARRRGADRLVRVLGAMGGGRGQGPRGRPQVSVVTCLLSGGRRREMNRRRAGGRGKGALGPMFGRPASVSKRATRRVRGAPRGARTGRGRRAALRRRERPALVHRGRLWYPGRGIMTSPA